MEKQPVVVDDEIMDPVTSKHGDQPELRTKAWEQVISTIPDVVATISSIAKQYATTHNQLMLLEGQGRQLLIETYTYIEKVSADQKTMEKRGQIIFDAMDRVHRLLADPTVPEVCRVAYAQHLPSWVQTLVAAVSSEGKQSA